MFLILCYENPDNHISPKKKEARMSELPSGIMKRLESFTD